MNTPRPPSPDGSPHDGSQHGRTQPDAPPAEDPRSERRTLDLTLVDLLDLLDARLPVGERWLVTLDGRSGSGKSTVCEALHERHPEAEVLHLDDLYRGWDALPSGVHAAGELVEAWTRGESPVYHPTQWPGMPPRHDATVYAGRPLIVEGVGAAWVGRDIAVTSVWLEAERERRRVRAIERDGATFAPYWLTWENEEAEWFAEHPDTSQLVVRVAETSQP